MRESLRRALSVVMVFAVVGAGTVAMINLDQGPEPVQQYGPVQEGEAIAPLAAAGIALIAGGGGLAAGAYLSDDVDEDALRAEDDKETHYQIYTQAVSSAEGTDQNAETVSNWMEDAAQIARMEGQNAYIRELENSSGSLPAKTTVKAEATKEVNNWISERQVRVIRNYEKAVVDWESMYEVAVSEANESYASQMWTTKDDGLPVIDTRNTTTTLANGSSVSYRAFEINEDVGDSSYAIKVDDQSQGTYDPPHRANIHKTSPGKNYGEVLYFDETADLHEPYNETVQALDEAVSEVKNFVDATYDQYERGQIDTSDLITPTLATRNYAPDDDNGVFTQRALTRMGYSLPTDFSSSKTMNLVADGTEYQGVLLSDGKPSGGFEIGTEYQVANIDGKQFVQTSSDLLEIEDNVTIQSVQQTDGSTKDSGTVEYTNPDYESADSLEGYRNHMQNLSETQAEINARQKALMNDSSGGTGDLIPDIGGLPYDGAGVVVVVLSLLGLAAVSRSN